MNRAKTFDATGIAPNGRLYAGDLNLIQDLVAALADFTQNVQVGSIAIGDSGIQISKFGTGEAQIGAAFRVLGILRSAAGILPPSMSSATRDAISAGSRPYGMVIVNTTTNRVEWNKGSDATPNWQPIGPAVPVATADLADAAVTTVKLADNSVTSTKIVDGTIVAGDIADGAITSAKILDATISTGDIADGAITSVKIADGTIVTADVADGAITSAKIADGTIVTGDLADSSVTSAKIVDGTIDTADLKDGSITSAKIVDGTIVTGDLADSAVTSAKIADGTIVTADLADGSVTSAKIADGTISTVDIADGAVTDAKMATFARRVLQRYRGAIGAPIASKFSSALEFVMFPAYGLLGGLLSTNRKVTITIYGDVIFNRAAGDSITYSVKYGSATFVGDSITQPVQSANRRKFKIVIEIIALDDTHQLINGEIMQANGQPTVGYIPIDGSTGEEGAVSNIDSATDQNIQVTAINSVNSSFVGWRTYAVDIELS